MNIAISVKRTLSKINLPFLCLVIIVLLNAFLKTHQYLEREFLWFDEVKLAINIQNRTYLQLFQSLDHGQIAPPLFLVSTKFLVSIFGDNERVFRLLPYLASIFNPVLLFVVLKKRLKTVERLLCVLFFCFAPLCIRYASEFKPYGTDIFFGLLAYWALAHFDKNLSLKALLSYSFLFILLPLFSIPVVFILGTFLLFTFFETLSNRKQMFFIIFLTGCVILTYLIVYYNFTTHHHNMGLFWGSKVGTINDSWESFATKTYRNYLLISRKNLGFESFSILGSVIFFLGVFRYLKRDFKNALLFFLPILFCFIASCLLIYPFYHRMVLFLYPSFFLGLSLGVAYFMNHKILIFKVLGLSLLLTLIFHPFKTAIQNYKQPYQDAQTEKLLMIVDRKIDTPDPIYLYYRSSYAWRYHWPRISNKKVSPVIVTADTFAQKFEAAPKTDRFWLIFFRCHRSDHFRDRNKILEEVKKTAFCSQEYNQDNDSAYLCYYLKKFKRVA